MKKVNYRKSIIVGFLAVYVMSMFFSTDMVMESYEERHANEGEELARDLSAALSAVEIGTLDEKQLYYFLTHPFLGPSEFRYSQYSVAVYDEASKQKIAQTSLMMTDSFPYHLDMSKEKINAYPVGQYMKEDLQERLVQVELETREAERNADYPKYTYFFMSNGESDNMGFAIQKIIWDKSMDAGVYHPLTSKIDTFESGWEWRHSNSSWEHSKTVYTVQNFMYYDLGIMVPYLEDGYQEWKRWQTDEFMHNFPKSLIEEMPTTEEYSMFSPIKTTKHIGGEGYYMLFRQTSNPWLAAVDYMKPVYITSFILMLACMLKVLYTTEKTYKERAKLEETRRDFTNAIAHELKTPLGVIRGFAENLKENTNEEKRDYYLDQIVGQTERMDEMVKEMIYISKLDSDKLVLGKEQVSMKQMISEELESLDIYIEEKQLNVIFEGAEDWLIQGDEQYLKKAIWNVISNAVEYNCMAGRIIVTFEEGACKIKNTGPHIPEEDLAHVFDMFHTGNKSRTSGEKHLGLGLYLTKKILDLHKLQISIANIEDGVEVMIKK